MRGRAGTDPTRGDDALARQLRGLQRTTDRIAAVINESRRRIDRIAGDVDELLYQEQARGAEQPAAAGAAKSAPPALRPPGRCQGCGDAGRPATERIVTEGRRRGVAYCARCGAAARAVLERHEAPYETARLGG